MPKIGKILLNRMKRFLLVLILLTLGNLEVFAQPESISNLTALTAGIEGEILLEWTVPDPGVSLSSPTAYLVKYATAQITTNDFYSVWTSTYYHSWSNLLSSSSYESRTLTGLTPGDTYFFAVVAIDSDTAYGVWRSSDDTSGAVNSANFAVTLDTAPVSVQNLSVIFGNALCDLIWGLNNESDISRYEISRSSYSDTSGFGHLEYILHPGTTHQDFGLINGNTYFYKIRAEDNTSNLSVYSSVVSTMPYVALSSPVWTSDAIAVSTVSINWAWQSISDAEGYRVINSTSNDVLSGDLSSSTTFYLQSILTPDTSTEVYVQVYSGFLTVNSDSLMLFSLSNPPTGFYSPLQPGTTSVNLQWFTNQNQSHTRYNVEVSTDNSNWSLSESLTLNTTYQNTGLKEYSTYYYRVWSVNYDGIESSKITLSTITSSVAPQSPTFSSARSDLVTNDGEVRLQWLSPYDDDADERVTAYLIKKATFQFTAGEFNFTNVSTVTQSITPITVGDSEDLVVTGLYPGSTCFFAIKSIDEIGNLSAMSVIRSTTVRDNLPPVPESVSALAMSENTVRISWTHPSISGYDDRKSYMIYRATFNFTLSSQSTYYIEVSTYSLGTYFDDSTGGGSNPLVKETTYYYMVSTKDLGDGPAESGLTSKMLESVLSSVVWARTPDLTGPSAITELSAGPGNEEGEISLYWVAPPEDSDTEKGDISGGIFRIDYSDNPSTVFTTSTYKVDIATTIAKGTTNYRSITGLNAGATYYFRIWSTDESGNWSGLSLGATTWAQSDVTPPGAITEFSATPSWRRLNLSWVAPGDDGYTNNISSGVFEVKYSSVSDMSVYWSLNISTDVSSANVSAHTVTGLTNDVTYYFSIKTKDDSGNLSNVSISTPSAIPVNTSPAAFDLGLPQDSTISVVNTPLFSWDYSFDADSVYGDSVAYSLVYSTGISFSLAVTTTVLTGTASFYQLALPLWENKTIYWKVLAEDLDGGTTASHQIYSLDINTSNSSPGAFSLISPIHSISTNTANPVLSWNVSTDQDPGDVVTYKVEYSTTQGFSTYITSSGISGLSYTLNSLTENLTYWWRVWAEDGIASTLGTPICYFKINTNDEPPLAFSLTSPADNSRELSLKVTFYWDITTDPDPDDNVVYNFCYSEYLSFVPSTTISGLTEGTTAINLPYDNRKYYWKVEAEGSDGQKTASNQTYMVYTDNAKETPASFTLIEPGYGVTISTTLQPLFIWNSAVDNDPYDTVRYDIDVSVNPDFSGSHLSTTGTDTYYQPLSNLLDQTTYYWKVRASGYQYTPTPVRVDLDYVFSSTGMFAISMTNNAPQAFSLLSPENASTLSTKFPIFTWNEAVDADIGEEVAYTIYISSKEDFSKIALSASSLTDTSYSAQSPLLENTVYYWKVKAKDSKGLETLSSATYYFKIPILSYPAQVAGIKGDISQDQNTFILYWSQVTKNSDGTDITDLLGYNIYRSLSLQSISDASPAAFAGSQTNSWTDTSVRGGKLYYMIKAVDKSGIESINSLIIESLNPNKLNLVSDDKSVFAELPERVSKNLLAENNRWQKNLSVGIERNPSNESGDILRDYVMKVTDSDFNTISGYSFDMPVEMEFYYLSAIQYAQSRFASESLAEKDIGIYWHNGVEFIKIGGFVDEGVKRIIVRITKPGDYQLRRIVRASVFGLASLTPKKVFTPGVAPYEDMTFYVDNPSGDKVTGKVFDLKGEFISGLEILGDATLTTVILRWDGQGARKGVYIYQIEGDGKVVNGTIILAK